MTSLRQIQRAFAANLLADKPVQRGDLLAVNALSIQRLVNVYRNNISASLHEALAAAYPVIQKLVGPEFFRHLADCYRKECPPCSGDLQSYGEALPDFLGSFDAVSTLPYIVDVADLEWAYQIISGEAPVNFLDSALPKKPNSIHWPGLRFELASSCRLVSSPYPIFSIWRVNQEGYPGDPTIRLDRGSETVFVLRSANGVELWRLQRSEAKFVQALSSGATLGDTVEKLALYGRDFNLEALLVKYVQSGCLVIASTEDLNLGH